MYTNETFTPNMNAKLKNGGRKCMKMTMDEFIQRYKDFCQNIRDNEDYDDWWMTDEEFDEHITYGLEGYDLPVIKGSKWVGEFKVEFDMENYGHADLNITSTGIPYLVSWYGGDCEEPLVVFYYFDDKGKLRNYIPTKGNTYNPITKTAFGSENCSSKYHELCQKYKCENAEELMAAGLIKAGIPVNASEDVYDIVSNLHYNLIACAEDFESRVKP